MTNPPQQTEAWTILRLLTWTTDFFKSRGSDSARLDAEVLLAEALGCQRIELYTAFDTEPDERTRVAFREMVRRRAEGTPVAYLVGYKEFYSLKLRVNEHVLIPRPDTEHLVIKTLDLAKGMPQGQPLRVVDVGTGSGAIAIAVAKNLPRAKVLAIDNSAAALEIARYNVQQHDLTTRVILKQGDLLQPLSQTDPVDLICSNPPYVSQAEYDALPAEVRDHEPQTALLAGATGTEVIERLLAETPQHLKPGGYLVLELSPMIADQCVDLARSTAGIDPQRVGLVKDLAGMKRVLFAGKVPDPAQP